MAQVNRDPEPESTTNTLKGVLDRGGDPEQVASNIELYFMRKYNAEPFQIDGLIFQLDLFEPELIEEPPRTHAQFVNYVKKNPDAYERAVDREVRERGLGTLSELDSDMEGDGKRRTKLSQRMKGMKGVKAQAKRIGENKIIGGGHVMYR